jgi:hypothetical protein
MCPPPPRCRYVAQHRQHSALLAQFGELSAALASVGLPPQLQVSGALVLADLQPRVKLAEWHDSCRRSHEHFTQKVSPAVGERDLGNRGRGGGLEGRSTGCALATTVG